MSTTYQTIPDWQSRPSASASEDSSHSEGSPRFASFLLEVRNRAQVTIELVERINALMAEGGFDVTVTPTEIIGYPGKHPASNDVATVVRAHTLGKTRLINWTRDGTLVPADTVAQNWGVSPHTVDAARERGEIFSLWLSGAHWYPREALRYERPVLSAICHALGDVDSSSKLLFLLRTHGALGGKTVNQAIENGMLDRVIELAKSWGRI